MANEDLVSWNAILSGYSQEGNHGLEAIFVFIEMVGEGMGLITMYAKFDSIHDSIKVFEELNCREIISWNALISGYARNGLCQDALKTFLEATMKSKPNNCTFGSVLSAIGDAQDISLKYGQ
ncbi:pentatricopeptide repeat-containing protein At4g32430, mitochondrial [Prunus persica]|uniref:pentatricopeptide repeat-containing protein At4g32430, mitochondrial n=1 Tax=Prunus persica TaxID=3760 RepID=UPI0009AB788F|nr:pentatricopeptide repeat-containing protein At4g32430, mitochondrial [Prunus persica]